MRVPAPPRSNSDNCYYGVYYAIVDKNQDPEKRGRVKLRFPWLPGSGEQSSYWAQLAVPMVGKEYGTYFVPEKNDTVMVVFIDGNIRRPVVIGGMWNKSDTPPETNENGKNDFRFIKSRAGHRLLFDDSKKTKVCLTDTKNANYVGVGKFADGGKSPNKMEVGTPAGINGKPKQGVGVTSAEGSINLWCPKGTLSVTAKHVEMTASDKADVNAGGKLETKGGMSGDVISQGAGAFKGAKVKIN